MHLKLRNLTVFHAVMLTGSVSRAADRLGLTQPAVSLALTKLEDTLGYPLFNRSKGYLSPRPEAQLLHAEAELAILAFERFASKAKQIGRGDEGLVRVGSIGSTGIHFLPDIIAQYADLRPAVEVELQVRSSVQVSHFVASGQIDVGLVEAPAATQGLQATTFALPCVCIMRHDDPLAAHDVVTPAHLADRKLISVFEDHQLDRQMRQVFAQAGVPWQSAIRCYFFSIMRNLVAKSAGVAIVDAINGCADAHDGVVWRPFEPRLNFEIAVITRQGAALQSVTEDFVDMTIAALRAAEALSTAARPTGAS